jgi:4-amino-4-deoxy-L-arabinose transferase-like glycosyltransferase
VSIASGRLARHWPLVPILAAGAALRWWSPGRIALWRDEAQYVAVASLPDPSAIVSFLYRHESHPPLYYLVGHAGRALSGTVEAPMGILSLAASLGAIVLVYLIAGAAFSRTAAAIAAAGTALSIPLALYSVQLRPYALLSVLLLLSHAGLWRYWTQRSPGWLLVWAVASVAALYTHYLSLLVLAAQLLVACWLQWRGPALPRPDRLRLGLHVVAVAVACVPALWLLSHQATATAYPALRPLRIEGPPLLLAGLSMSFPFEIFLPVLLGLAALVGLLRGRRPMVLDGARALLVAPAPIFLFLALVATYRSQFLTPHVLLVIVPFSMLLFGGYVTSLFAVGRRWPAALCFEAGLCLAVLSAFGAVGYTKTTVDLVARCVAAEAHATDLLLLAPGVIGVSFNRYFDKANSQINYPYPGKIAIYPFDRDFDQVAAPAALQMALDSVHAAYSAGRRVWFIADGRWLRPDQMAPTIVSRDSFGGIGQADRARVNRLDRYLRWLYGKPVREVAVGRGGPGPEHFAAWLFERLDSTATETAAGMVAVP